MRPPATAADSSSPAPKHKGGRPPIAISWPILDALLSVQATLVEVAEHFGYSEDTIQRAVEREHGVGFAEYSAQKRAKGKLSLRRKQFQLALGGDRTMLIWLGKQYLCSRKAVGEGRARPCGAGATGSRSRSLRSR
ncbi:MAG: hypothetical protein HUU26_02795 [Gemmatimonadaceae bacterium]|nr:hypothetical protein [Gemmatimonadaceae bacterium]